MNARAARERWSRFSAADQATAREPHHAQSREPRSGARLAGLHRRKASTAGRIKRLAIQSCAMRKILKEEGACYEVFNERASIHSALGQRHQALADIDAMILLRPEMPNAYFTRAPWRIEEADFSSAVADLDKLVEIGDEYRMYVFSSGSISGMASKENLVTLASK